MKLEFSRNISEKKNPILMYRNRESPHIFIYLYTMYLVFVVLVN